MMHFILKTFLELKGNSFCQHFVVCFAFFALSLSLALRLRRHLEYNFYLFKRKVTFGVTFADFG